MGAKKRDSFYDLLRKQIKKAMAKVHWLHVEDAVKKGRIRDGHEILPKDDYLAVRITNAMKLEVKKQADLCGLSITDYLLGLHCMAQTHMMVLEQPNKEEN